MPANRRTNGPMNHVAGHFAKGAKVAEVQKINGGDSIAFQAIPSLAGGAGSARRF